MKFNNNNKNFNNKRKFININVRKSYTVAESKNAVLFQFDSNDLEQYYVWINKSAIFTSEFTDILDISLIVDKDFQYSIYQESNTDWKKPDGKCSGKELYDELMRDTEIASINRK